MPLNGALLLWWAGLLLQTPLVAAHATLQPLQAVSTQLTPVLSLGLSSEVCFSTQPLHVLAGTLLRLGTAAK